jgi:dTDP-4-dehydrorhamnose reductase
MVELLITGAHGQLGRALLAAAAARALSAEGHDLDTLDITDPLAVLGCVERLRPRVVVNCAAYTAVDRCETEEELATAVNGLAVGHLAAACNRASALLVHISTDYVFAGSLRRPYREEDPVAPLSAYGRSKLRGEEAARSAARHLVVRTAWLYGRGGVNFVEAIRRQVEGGQRVLKVVADQEGSPTLADDLAEALLDLIECSARGIVHAVSAGTTTWHGFACEIVRRLGAEVEVAPLATAELPRPARRPAYSVLDTTHLVSLIGRALPPWQDGLARYLEGRCGS